MNVARIVRTGASAGLAVWGFAMLVAPAAAARAATRGGPVPPEPIVRVLGGRRVVQHVLVAGTSSAAIAWVSVTTDVLHSASMVAAARIWPQYRKAELTSAAIAAGSAILTALGASGGARQPQ
jgi:hypothetical protein